MRKDKNEKGKRGRDYGSVLHLFSASRVRSKLALRQRRSGKVWEFSKTVRVVIK